MNVKRNDKEGPLISIITVVYNGVKTIEQTIQSVILQSYPYKEYIIIDGGSADGTLDIIKRYEEKITIWISEPDKGIYDAMNKGINLANGDLIGIINADDWYEDGIFDTIAKEYRSDEVIYGMVRNFKDEEFYSIIGNSVRVLHENTVMHPTCFIPRNLYGEHGCYNTCYKYSADYDLVLRFTNAGVKFNFIEKIIANFRVGGISSTSAAEKEKFQIRRKYHIISNLEFFLRLIQIQIAGIIR